MGNDHDLIPAADTPAVDWADEEDLLARHLLVLGVSGLLSMYLVVRLMMWCHPSDPPAAKISTPITTEEWPRLAEDLDRVTLHELVERLETQMQKLESLLKLQETATYYHHPKGAKLHTNPYCGKCSPNTEAAKLQVPRDVDDWLYNSQKVHCSRCWITAKEPTEA